MKSIKQIKNLKGKKILLRVDFNVPIWGGKVVDDFRIVKALPTIKFLQKKGAKVILITHLGKGGETLSPVFEALNKYIKVQFVPEIIGPNRERVIIEMKNGDVVLLENLRKEEGEKKCDKNFAKALARGADAYVNEAFSVSHRGDASIVLLPKILPAYAGLHLMEEVKNLSQAFLKPKHPFLFILGGAKFSTKVPLIKKYLKLADYVFVGGALANDLLKKEGYEVGQSLVDDTDYGLGKILKNKKLILPSDVVVKSDKELINKKVNEVGKDETIIDMGKESIKTLAFLVQKSKFILWNGPLGKYEDGGEKSTIEILKLIRKGKSRSILGGGDLVSVFSSIEPKNSKLKSNLFVSTGGGATLDFLVNGTLPGIKMLQ